MFLIWFIEHFGERENKWGSYPWHTSAINISRQFDWPFDLLHNSCTSYCLLQIYDLSANQHYFLNDLMIFPQIFDWPFDLLHNSRTSYCLLQINDLLQKQKKLTQSSNTFSFYHLKNMFSIINIWFPQSFDDVSRPFD